MSSVHLRAGASGFGYKAWKGSFYPEKLPDGEMLPYYAARLPAVEINNTFYRMPTPAVLTGWADQTPASFRFAIKASRLITHTKRLKDAGALVDHFFKSLETLDGKPLGDESPGSKLGPVLFQLPPTMKKDLARLEDFLALVPAHRGVTFEFRHPSWFADEVFEALRAHEAALCVAESEEMTAPVIATAGWGYLRLRRQDYTEADLAAWAERIRAQPWSEAYVFFKHEDAGRGPKLAAQLLELFGQ